MDVESQILLEEDLFDQDIYNPIGKNGPNCGGDVVDGQTLSNEGTKESNIVPSYFDMAKETVKTLSTYTAAALAVGIGFAYAYFKQQ